VRKPAFDLSVAACTASSRLGQQALPAQFTGASGMASVTGKITTSGPGVWGFQLVAYSQARGNAEPRWVRVVTDGHAPVGNSVVEEIVAPAGPQPFAALQPLDGGLRSALDDVTLAVPVCPSKILCVGRNYRAHAEEMGNEVPTEPLIFLKPPSSVIDSGAAIVLPEQSNRVEFEGESGVIVGSRLRFASGNDALRAIRGVVAGNDVAARDLQKSDGQWTIRDNDSRNGTMIADGKLERDHPLRPGDVIRIGRSQLAFVEDLSTAFAELSSTPNQDRAEDETEETLAGIREGSTGYFVAVVDSSGT
jgi:hypothetical protein